MKCPYCGGEMILGIISGDGHERLHWKSGDTRASIGERMRKKGSLENVQYFVSLTPVFEIDAVYCEKCQLMMFKTGIRD